MQAQLIPQLIINYKLKVWRFFGSRVSNGVLTGNAECGPHAHESDDLQDAVYGC
jgi:hypothetical protein